MISTARSRVRKPVQQSAIAKNTLKNLSTAMTRHDCNQNEELVLYCDVMTEKAIYRIQPGLSSGGFYRNKKKGKRALDTRNKTHKENGSLYERSVSVPALGAQTGSSPVTSPETRTHQHKLRVVLPPPNSSLRPSGRHASEGTERSISTYAQMHHSMDYDTHPGTPGTPKDFLTSPPIDSAASFQGQGGNSAESGGLFILKKDAERRTKLIDILTEDAPKLCAIWAEDQAENQINCLTDPQMQKLATAMREFIYSQDPTSLDHYLKELQNEVLQTDQMTMEELQRSIYSLNEASVKILKERQMPPHWMFTFDDFLKTTIKHSIEFLTPELRSDDSIEDDSITTPTLHTSMSMMNGLDCPSVVGDAVPSISKYRKVEDSGKFQDIQRLQEEYAKSQEDNFKLLRELNMVDRNYQQLLRGVLREKKAHVQSLADAIAMPPPTPLAIGTSMCGIDSPPAMSDSQPDSPEVNLIVPQISLPPQVPTDEKMVKWLESLNCDRVTISKFVSEEYTLCDVMELVSRDDLRRMNLRGGVECRIWREIVRVRQTGNHSSVYSNNMDSD